MAGCCSKQGYDEFFTEKTARRDAWWYRRFGLDRSSRRLVGFLARRNLRGGTAVDVGGGVGTLSLALLKAGAEKVVTVDLSSGYDVAANELAREAGAENRIERRVLDFAEQADEVPRADAVVMHRVVCCYPDYESLLAAAAGRAERLLAFSFPRRTWWIRIGATLMNAVGSMQGSEFRGYVHRPDRLVAAAESHGLRQTLDHEGWFWCVAGFERST